MIEKLTKEQESKFQEYVDKWLKIGLSTERVDKKRAKEIMDGVYEHILKKDKVPVVVMGSPCETWIAVNIYAFNKFNGNQVSDQVSNQVSNQVRSQ